MTFSPGLGLRLAAGAVAILVLCQLAIVASSVRVRGEDFDDWSGPAILRQLESGVALMDTLPPEDRPKALRAMTSPFLRFEVLDAFPDDRLDGPPLPEFATAIDFVRRGFPDGRPIRMYRRLPETLLERMFQRRAPLRTLLDTFIVVVRLEDGSALVVEPSATYRRQMVMNLFALATSLLGLVSIGLLVWVGFATARPLSRMAKAAERFAGDLDAPPIPEQGPKPVRHLARSFNDMQRRIRDLVRERATTLAAMAHDFRTYLTRLRLRAEFIGDEAQRDKAIRDLDEMASLVDDTLLFVRMEQRGVTVEAASGTVLAEIAQDLVASHHDLGHKVTLTIGPDADHARVPADAVGLKRALGNLIENAVRYGETAEVTVHADQAGVHAHIRDRGPGVPAEHLERLTEPFFRLESSRSRNTGGAGLGLAITRRLTEASGGRLTLRNHPEGGFEAEVSLPRASSSAL